MQPATALTPHAMASSTIQREEDLEWDSVGALYEELTPNCGEECTRDATWQQRQGQSPGGADRFLAVRRVGSLGGCSTSLRRLRTGNDEIWRSILFMHPIHMQPTCTTSDYHRVSCNYLRTSRMCYMGHETKSERRGEELLRGLTGGEQ